MLISLGFVIIRILHNDGSETEVAVPTGASATVNPDGSVAVKLPDGSRQKLLVTKRTARRLPQGQWVPLVKSVEDLQAWQRRGNGTVAYINNALQLQDAAVSYPTLAIDLVIRVNVQITVNGPSSARVTLREQPGGSYAAVLEDGKTLVVGVTEKDEWRELKKAAVSIAPDQLVALEFSAVGDVLSVSLDGKQVCEVRDTTYRSGSPGLAVTKGVTLFKDIQVKVLRGEEEIASSGDEPTKNAGASAAARKVGGEMKSGDKSPHSKGSAGKGKVRLVADDDEDVPWDLPKDAPLPAVFPFDAVQARRHQEAWAKYLGVPVEQTNSLGMKFAIIPPGEFELPFTKDGETEVTPDTPRERLRLVRPIYVGTTEVTFEQFKKFAEATGYQTDAEQMGVGRVPPDWKTTSEATWKKPWQRAPTANEPVTQVSANDAMAFCDWLTIFEYGDKSPIGRYRLPGDAEWYFAARAGSQRRFVLGDSPEDLAKAAWYGLDLSQVKDNGVHPVAQKQPNPFGLFDTLGHVWEICADRKFQQSFLSTNLVDFPCRRGGGFGNSSCPPEALAPLAIVSDSGFRIVREISSTPGYWTVESRRLSVAAPHDSIVFAQRKRFVPLSAKAIVSRPAKIPGVRSWSVELAGHQGLVQAIAWSPKGDLIATAGNDDGSVRLWDREGRLQKVLLGHEGAVWSVAFSPDGSLLASSDMGGSAATYQMRVWDVSTGVCVAVVPSGPWLWCVAFSPSGQNIAFAAQRGITVLNLRTRKLLVTTETCSPLSIAWSPDGSRLMSLEEDGKSAKVWDARIIKKVAELQAADAQRKIVGLQPSVWSPDGRSIAAPCSDGAWRIWDGETFELRKTLKRPGDSPLGQSFGLGGALLFWKQTGQLVTPLAANRLLTWDVEKGEVVAEVDFPAAGAAFALSPDQSELVSWHPHRPYLDFVDVETGKSVRRGPVGGQIDANGVQISPDGQQIVTSAKGSAGIWDGNTGRPVARNVSSGDLPDYTWKPLGGLIVGSNVDNPQLGLSLFRDDTLVGAFKLKGEGKSVCTHAWSPDGKLLAAADIDNAIRVWDISKREVIGNLVGHGAITWKLAWSPDGKRLASRSEDKTVRLWGPLSGKPQETYEAFPEPIGNGRLRGLAWTPDSQRLWIGLSTHAVQLDVATGTFSPMEDFSNGNVVTSLSVSPDGHLLARENYGWTYLRTIGADGSPSRRLLGNGLGRYPVWHPDSRRFLGSDRGHVVTFDIQTNRRLGTLFPWITGDHWMCVSPEGHIRGGHFAPDQAKFDPADTAIPASLKEQIVYVALLDDGSQVTLSPDEFAATFGWQNDPNQAYLLGPTP